MDGYFFEKREFEWKLHNFTQELLKVEKIYWSENFSMFLDNYLTSWSFYIKFEGGQCGVYLSFEESEIEDFTVKFNVFLKQLNNEKFLLGNFLRTSNEFKMNKSYGWIGLVPVHYICQNPYYFLKNKTLTLGLNVELTKKKEVADRKTNNEYQRMCIDYFETKSYSDFKLVCSDGIEIPVHRFVLAGISPVMKDIFDTKSAESTLISIKDIDGETMTEILRYIYTREVRNIKKLTLKLLYGADKYELNELKKLCVSSMIAKLSVKNAIDYFILADQYDIKVLQERCAVFIKSHYKKFPKDGPKWKKLTNKFLTKLLDHYDQNPGDICVFKSTLYFYISFKDGYFGLYLKSIASEIDDYTVKCNVFVRKLNKEKFEDLHIVRTSNEFKTSQSHGWYHYIKIEQIFQNSYHFLKNNTLTLKLKVELTKKKEVTNHQFDNEFQKLCIDYFETKLYSDFQLVCSDGVKIPVHRFVLAGFSSVMKEIFNTKSTKSTVISIKDIDGETMTEILRFIYTREVHNMKELAVKLLYGADKYELDNLKKLCVASMIENLSVKNAIDYFILADQYDIKPLQENSAMFIKSHHKELFKDGKNWKKLTNKFLIILLDSYHQNPGDTQIFESTL